ncbi:MAG: hypothetical protein FDX30_06935 [Chlorobium sp.]|nr:MAG: hypothetical protein FDX30_06935 [Chlorobium sp.]
MIRLPIVLILPLDADCLPFIFLGRFPADYHPADLHVPAGFRRSQLEEVIHQYPFLPEAEVHLFHSVGDEGCHQSVLGLCLHEAAVDRQERHVSAAEVAGYLHLVRDPSLHEAAVDPQERHVSAAEVVVLTDLGRNHFFSGLQSVVDRTGTGYPSNCDHACGTRHHGTFLYQPNDVF